ncbi:polymorphic toxin-type HINT domain-containing protein [Streptomyces sp. MJM8645]|uniref:polymorphic toxin-type HINT domain-containing protein n=3 Tax=Kitasatosporales TaxID=85011 RepID=UPI0007AF826C|nr:polymorphic toxin-type HINT domain-containing protein [Streptomyces sp. MJM8645]
MVGGLLTGLLTVPAAAADIPPATGPNPDRVRTVAAWQSGGPAVRQAAENALIGSDDDLKKFLATGQAAAADQDLRTQIEELVAKSGPGVREAGTAALKGSAADLQAFLDKGVKKAFEDDQRVLLSQIMAAGGPGVKDAAGKAMDGSLADVTAFLNEGQFKARNDDDRVHLSQLMASGGSEVKKAAGAALDGSMDDVQLFLQYGYQTAAAHDQETLTVSQLADLTTNASTQAGQQAQTAKDAAGKALDATKLAKEAAERAAAETKAAQGSAGQASNAAGRAADAANRAANAAQTASKAAKAANEASRQAANAAADAASAATKAGDAAARALAAAGGAAGDASKADLARNAAVTARNAASDARTAGEASQWAGRAAAQAGIAAQAAASAGINAQAAADAAAEAAGYSGEAGGAADRARQAAARARSAAAEATRAAKATLAIANQAAAAAGDAQRAANSAAAHADAAAAAADEAANHAGNAGTWANTAQAAATAASAAADSAANSAEQAHKIADVARASDTERLTAQQAAEMAAAEEASRQADQKAKTAAWESGKATQLAADTEQLIKDATAAGTDAKTAVLKGRQAALRLMASAGPWTKAAAQSALEGDDDTVQVFLTTDLTTARSYDDRTSALAIAQGPGKLELRLAAETASVGTPEQVRAFLTTGQYPGKDDDDRVQLSQIMAAGGPGVKEAAGKALDGTIDDVRVFLTTGQYKARQDDNRVLVTQAMATGGPEVQAAAQAVMSGPTDRLEPFLQSGLFKARERDALTATHVATITSYLATIDGSVAQARQYAYQAAQSYADARGAADEAAGYANQARTSATTAADWAAKAAASAQAAQASAQQAAQYAKQAQASAASATDAASRASASAAAAAGYAAKASKFAADAKTAADQAKASAAAAAKSRDEAYAAAREAAQLIMSKQQTEDVTRQAVVSGTAGTNGDERAYYVEVVERPGFQKKVIADNLERCDHGTMGVTDRLVYGDGNWHKNDAGVLVCDVTTTAQFTGTVDYLMRTCPEPGLTVEQCRGKYSVWDTIVLSSTTLDRKTVTATIQVTREQFFASGAAPVCFLEVCYSGAGAGFLANVLYGDAIECINHPGATAACGFALANLLPAATVLKGAKAIAAFRTATATGIGIAEATVALDAALGATNQALVKSLTATAGLVTKARDSIRTGVGMEAALKALRDDPNAGHGLIELLESEGRYATAFRAACPDIPLPGNSFPAGTRVLMGDGTTRPIETIGVGDLVAAADPVSGVSGPRVVTDTIYTPDDRDFTELAISQSDGSSGAVTATDHHPFWLDATQAWTDAAALRVGDTLRTDDGATVQVASIRHWTGLEPAYNLTVEGLHTYYVLAGDTPVLVHNAAPANCDKLIWEILNKLPIRLNGMGPTTGQPVLRTSGGIAGRWGGLVYSGTTLGGDKDLVTSISNWLKSPESGAPRNAATVYPSADHVEAKVAWEMANKKETIKNAEVVINNQKGVCKGDGMTCDDVVPFILCSGQTLVVTYLNEDTGMLADPHLIAGQRKC